MNTALEIRLASRPVGLPTEENFEVASVAVPQPAQGQILVRNLVMSVDPYMRRRMNDERSYLPPFQLSEPLEGGAVGEVISSTVDGFRPGDTVLHDLGWREYAVLDPSRAVHVDPALAPVSAYLGVLGMPGLAAYAGLLEVGELRKGDVVFVSGAAGAVGSAAGQIARLRGASRVVGSAGTAEKVLYLKEELGFDAAFNYRDGPVLEQLAALVPDGVDLYFDNVGGEHLEAAIATLNDEGRVVLCGAITEYNNTEPAPGPRNLRRAISKRLTLRGLRTNAHHGLRHQFVTEVGEWITEGRLHYRETVVKGIRNAPAAFLGMLRGANTGKMLVELA